MTEEPSTVATGDSNNTVMSTNDITGHNSSNTEDPSELLGFSFVKQNRQNIDEKAKVVDLTDEGLFVIHLLMVERNLSITMT